MVYTLLVAAREAQRCETWVLGIAPEIGAPEMGVNPAGKRKLLRNMDIDLF
jgi:hypothetical protein